jgi:hypothetical protein
MYRWFGAVPIKLGALLCVTSVTGAVAARLRSVDLLNRACAGVDSVAHPPRAAAVLHTVCDYVVPAWVQVGDPGAQEARGVD